MDKLLPFIMHHWLLTALFAVALVLLFIDEARSKGLGGARVSPQRTVELLNRENAILWDIRDPNAFKEGHIAGATQSCPTDKDRSIVIACALGQKASVEMNKLQKQGYNKVYILAGGITAWKNAGLPLVKE